MKTFFGRVIAVIAGIILFFTLCFMVFSAFAAVLGGEEKVSVKPGSILSIDLQEPMFESDMEIENSIFSLGEQPNPKLLTLLKSIDKAKNDDDVKGISIKLNTTSTEELSQVELLRSKIDDFKKSGKFVYAYTNRASQNNYYLATVADSIFHNPMGTIDLKGLSMQVMFFKNMGEKYGIEFEIIRHGDYKAAVEPFMRDDLSEANREQLTQIVTQLWDGMSKKMSQARGISQAEFNQYTDSLDAFMPNKALKAKLVDILSQESDYEEFLKEKLNQDTDKDLKEIDFIDYAKTVKKDYDKNKIAVLYAHGTILPGDGQMGIQSETYKEAIQKIVANDKVKAVVLRINSGGGDANTSEEILHELKKIDSEIPLIASFGEVAASGGYYIATDCEKIFCEPYTITGSIGVLGMIPNAKGLLNNIGITTDHVQSNQNAMFYSPTTGLTPRAKETLKESTEHIYSIFVDHVAKNRKMTYEQVDALGGGRIYTGMEAKKLGLVDELGSLEQAITYAAEQAEITEYQIKAYPIKKTGVEALLKEMNLSAEMKTQIKNTMDPEMVKALMRVESLRKLDGIQMLWPYDYSIN